MYALEFHIERHKTADILANIAETDKVFLKEVATAVQPPERETVQIAACSVKQDKPKITPAEKFFSVKKEAAEAVKPDRVQIKSKDSSKPKRLQVRIYIKGQKEKPIKAFSSYDRTDLDHKANQWLAEQGYQTYQQSTGASFRWEV